MASVLRQLSDGDLEAIHHMIRRDAHTDLEIAVEAQGLLGREISTSDAGRAEVVRRYRNSEPFQAWLKRWRAERSDMHRALAEQGRRFEMIRETILEAEGTGIERVSKALQARALSLAAQANDAEFLSGLNGKGPFANALKLAQATVKDVYRQKVEALKAQLAELGRAGGDAPAGIEMDVVVQKVDEIMGLK